MLHNAFDDLRARRVRGDRGFTLIELLVVVVIIGILIAIAIPVYLSYQKGAANKSAAADTRNGVAAVEQCTSQNGSAYPATSATNPVTASGSGGVMTLTCGTQRLNITISPNNTLGYYPAGDGKSYTLGAQAGGRGDKVFYYTSTVGRVTEYVP